MKPKEIIEDETNRLYVRTKDNPDGELIMGKEVSSYIHKQIIQARIQELGQMECRTFLEKEQLCNMIEERIAELKNEPIFRGGKK